MDKRIIALLLVFFLAMPLFSGCFEKEGPLNEMPSVEIEYPRSGATVSNLVMISGSATDPDGDDTIIQVEVKIDDGEWNIADGTAKWSFDWRTYENDDGVYSIFVRSWDGIVYSETQEIRVRVSKPVTVETDFHGWAIFVVAANFPKDNESKLGNAPAHKLFDTVAVNPCEGKPPRSFDDYKDGITTPTDGSLEGFEGVTVINKL